MMMYGTIMLFFSLSGGEIFLILFVAFLVFGPDKFPELARKIGKGINEIKRASASIKDEINRETGDLKKDLDVEEDIAGKQKKQDNQKKDKEEEKAK